MNSHGPQRSEVTQHIENDNRYFKKKVTKGRISLCEFTIEPIIL